jgi:hypothetical protein
VSRRKRRRCTICQSLKLSPLEHAKRRGGLRLFPSNGEESIPGWAPWGVRCKLHDWSRTSSFARVERINWEERTWDGLKILRTAELEIVEFVERRRRFLREGKVTLLEVRGLDGAVGTVLVTRKPGRVKGVWSIPWLKTA